MYQVHSPHSFYIPVMGTGFTIDTPLYVAKYGISSVISLVDDTLIEQMRKYWCERSGEPYEAIEINDKDARAKRITAYLNLIQRLIEKQIAAVRAAPFEPNSDIVRYFEMLPENQLKLMYSSMLAEVDKAKKAQLQEQLRQAITAGSIDVNIMTKLDRPYYHNGEMLPYEFCDAAAALRGYANSNLCSTVIFSAGFNSHLYGYVAKFDDFFPDKNYEIKKKICLKVSDYRSAAIQGKYLAKHGLWVSEYRIESPLNCGGHAFVNDGQLLGPILADFREHRQELVNSLYSLYKSALQNTQRHCADTPQKVKITAQGGVGTSAEHALLLNYYQVDAVGWGTPFLMVPEATNVDEATLEKLAAIKDDEVFLSTSSPLGVPFWNLKNSSSEERRLEQIKKGIPGSYCVKGHLRFNEGLTKQPVCRASREFQRLKLEQLATSGMSDEQLAALKEEILSKACICHELGGGVLIKNNIDTKIASAICPGPNIVNFKKIATLKEMVGHIYGRCSLLASSERPHMFMCEIQLQINYLFNEIRTMSLGLPVRSQQKIAEVKEKICDGIRYYQEYAKELFYDQKEKALIHLEELQAKIDQLQLSLS